MEKNIYGSLNSVCVTISQLELCVALRCSKRVPIQSCTLRVFTCWYTQVHALCESGAWSCPVSWMCVHRYFFMCSHQLCHQRSTSAPLLVSQRKPVLCPPFHIQDVPTSFGLLWNSQACFCPIIFLSFLLSLWLVFGRGQENWCC